MRRFLGLLAATTLLAASVLTLAVRAQPAWTVGGTNLIGSNHLSSIAYGNGVFVATTILGTRPGVIWSRDGLTWTYSSAQIPFAMKTLFVAGTFYLVAEKGLWRSTDGLDWEKIHTPAQATGVSSRHLIASNGTSMLLTTTAADATLEFSPDLRSWRRTAPLPNAGVADAHFEVLDLVHFRGRYFAIYYGGPTPLLHAAVTTDGMNWSSLPAIAGANTLAATDERLLALRGFETIASTDGTTFTTSRSAIEIMNTKFVSAGGRIFSLQTLRSTRDGAAWTVHGTHTFPNDGSLILNDVAFGNGRYVAVGTSIGAGGSLSFRDAVRTIAGSGWPTLARPPVTVRGIEGQSATLQVALDVTEPGTTYRWFRDGVLLNQFGSTYTIASVKAADAGRYSVEVRNSFGTTTGGVAVVTVGPVSVAPTLVAEPASVVVTAGQSATFSINAAGTPPLRYQWFRNNEPIPGAIGATLTLEAALPSHAGNYTVIVSNDGGNATSGAALLTVNPISRISNLSVLTTLGSGVGDFTLGYVIGGGSGTPGSKPVVLRAAGPSLSALGVHGPLDDPKLETFTPAGKTGENDDWGGTVALATAFANVGAFPFSGPSTRDAALVTTLGAGDNSVRVSPAGPGTGLVLAEVYDAVPDASFTLATPRLLNVSVLKPLGSGLTVGFTIAGLSPKTVVIRAVGPTLAGFGVADPLPDPKFTLFNADSTKLAENDNWGGTAVLTATFASVGAFLLPSGSSDAALRIDLPPGGYSVEVSGVGGAGGTALVEVYEVP